MKRESNMLAEVMALPYSEYMFEHDPIRTWLAKSTGKTHSPSSLWNVEELWQVLDEECQYAADYINRFTDLTNLTELQSVFHYVFPAKDICAVGVELDRRFLEWEEQRIEYADTEETTASYLSQLNSIWKVGAFANQFYLRNIEKLAKTFLTIRSGKAVLRYWDGPDGAYFNQREPLPHADTVSRAKTAVSHSFQPERIESWHSLLQCIPEDLILSCFAASLTKTGAPNRRHINSFEILKGFGDTVCLADVLMDKVLDRGMAETHIHAGASRSFGAIWETMLNDPDSAAERDYALSYKGPVKKDRMQTLAWEAATVRLLLAVYLVNCGTDFFRFLASGTLRTTYTSSYISKVIELCKSNHVKAPFHYGLPSPRAILKVGPGREDLWKILQLHPALQWSNPSLAERYFLTWAIIHATHKPTDVGFTATLLYYIRLKSTAYRLRVQDSKSKGLLYFQQFYNLSTDTGGLKQEEKLTQIISTALQDSRVIKTELRIRPAFSEAETVERAREEIKAGIKSYLRCFIKCHLYSLCCLYAGEKNEEKQTIKYFSEKYEGAIRALRHGESDVLLNLLRVLDVDPKRIPDHKIGLVYHMIKRGEKGEKSSCFAVSCGSSPRSKAERYSFGTARFQAEAAIAAISDLRDACPEIAGLIVGIDAAALEIPTEPWVFAPAFQQARSRNAELAYEGRLAVNKPLLGVTYHVGEDFRHPLSGLRHIDEAIEYYRLHSGDRIGHGLALGIDLDRWFQLHRMFPIPRIEALENYLWAWSLLANDSMTRTLAPFTSLIESKIMDYANEIYGSLDGITIDNLYQAYMAKTLPTEEIQRIASKRKGTAIPDCIGQLDSAKIFPCFQNRSEKDETRNEAKDDKWNTENLILSYHCRFYKQRMNAPVMVNATEDQLALTKELQLYLRKKIANIGLIIESNPSSNAVVGEIDGILRHPASVLRNPGDDTVLTSINTDDPSVFNATMANEHAHIYYALRTAGYTVETSLKVVNEMRGTGLNSSFIRDVPCFERLLKEYEAILCAL